MSFMGQFNGVQQWEMPLFCQPALGQLLVYCVHPDVAGAFMGLAVKHL